MNILVIGGGGRENTIVWKIKQNPDIKELYCSPGNGGIGLLANLIPSCAHHDWNSYAEFVRQKRIDLTVVGPEAPLADGMADYFRKEGLKIFGPDKKSTQLESSKIFSKRFMKKYGIPTADFEVFENAEKAFDYCQKKFEKMKGCVIKADGLAAGKGVSVCQTVTEAEDAVRKMMVQKIFGSAGEKILIEEMLEGEELSLMAFCDGKSIKLLPPARDYKRVFDGQKGPNTGGMGAMAPVKISKDILSQIEESVAKPFLRGIQEENLDYRGVIYFGIMLTKKGHYVLEFNIRFGDPETQVVLPLVKTDIIELFNAVINQSLEKVNLEIADEFCVSVVCASGGYPEKYENHKKISGLSPAESPQDLKGDSFVFHAGTMREGDFFYTNGGRVLNVTAKGKTLEEARKKCYDTVSKISFEGMHYRKDIAKI